jgi:hypothetical protein
MATTRQAGQLAEAGMIALPFRLKTALIRQAESEQNRTIRPAWISSHQTE